MPSWQMHSVYEPARNELRQEEKSSRASNPADKGDRFRKDREQSSALRITQCRSKGFGIAEAWFEIWLLKRGLRMWPFLFSERVVGTVLRVHPFLFRDHRFLWGPDLGEEDFPFLLVRT
jgi:hypothetical protein